MNNAQCAMGARWELRERGTYRWPHGPAGHGERGARGKGRHRHRRAGGRLATGDWGWSQGQWASGWAAGHPALPAHSTSGIREAGHGVWGGRPLGGALGAARLQKRGLVVINTNMPTARAQRGSISITSAVRIFDLLFVRSCETRELWLTKWASRNSRLRPNSPVLLIYIRCPNRDSTGMWQCQFCRWWCWWCWCWCCICR
jgi:hypothetical protein